MPKTILIVDDDRMSLELSRRKLLELGYEILVAGDGQQALGHLSQKIPDMIILDVEMPGMNGYTFIMEKNKNPAYTKIPVVMLTAHEENAPMFKRHGVRGYLIKPLNMEQLLGKVNEIVGPAV